MHRRIQLFIGVLLIVGLVLLVAPVWAGGDDIEQTAILKGGDNTATNSAGIGSSRSYGLGGGDMDIRDCLATHSILFGLWQGTHVNPLCEADRADRDGKYLSAAELRCSTRKYQKSHGHGQKCIDAVIRAEPTHTDFKVTKSYEGDDDDHDALEARVAEIEANKANEVRKAKKSAERAQMYTNQAKLMEVDRQEGYKQLVENLKK